MTAVQRAEERRPSEPFQWEGVLRRGLPCPAVTRSSQQSHKAVTALSLLQLHRASLTLRLARSQHSQEVRQLREQVAELQHLLEGERWSAQQLHKECALQEENGRRLEAQQVRGDKASRASWW